VFGKIAQRPATAWASSLWVTPDYISPADGRKPAASGL